MKNLIAIAALLLAAACNTAAPATTKPVAVTKPAANPHSDKGWVVQTLLTKNDGLGDWGGTARVTNTQGDSRTGVFTFTLFRKGVQVGTLQGSSMDTQAGRTVTVDLISQDKITTGAVTWEFQTDISN